MKIWNPFSHLVLLIWKYLLKFLQIVWEYIKQAWRILKDRYHQIKTKQEKKK